MLASFSVTHSWFEGKHTLQKTGETVMVWGCETSCGAQVSLKPPIQFCEVLFSLLKNAPYVLNHVFHIHLDISLSWSWVRITQCPKRPFLLAFGSQKQKVRLCQMQMNSRPLRFKGTLQNWKKTLHVPILIFKIFRHDSLSQSVVSPHENRHKVVKNASLLVPTQIY